MVFDIIKTELMEIREKYGDERRSEIILDAGEINLRDLLANEPKLITVTNTGYLKSLPLATYSQQNRGGKGMSGMSMRSDDFVNDIFVAHTFDYILFFTNQGRCFARYAHTLPEGSRTSKGKAMVNFLNLIEGEKVTTMIPVQSSVDGQYDNGDSLYITMVTKKGLVKKSPLSEYASAVRENGILAIRFATENDEVVGVKISDNTRQLVMGTYLGKAIRFPEAKVRSVGRVSQGVKGIELVEEDFVIGMEILSLGDSVPLLEAGIEDGVEVLDVESEPVSESISEPEIESESDGESEEIADSSQPTLLVVTEKGYGKRTRLSHYRITNRAGKGVLNIKVNHKIGNVVGFMEIKDEDNIILISSSGKVIRMQVSEIPCYGRATQGVKVINLSSGDVLVGVSRISGDLPDGASEEAEVE
jgi:DNA gyrase subunit A